MYMYIPIEKYKSNQLIFQEPVENIIRKNSNFIRLIYSTTNFSCYGISLGFYFKPSQIDKYFKKLKYSFNIISYSKLLETIQNIEYNILNSIQSTMTLINKIPKFDIYEQMIQGNVRLFQDDTHLTSNLFILKISGIWETINEYGLTFKFIKPNYIY